MDMKLSDKTIDLLENFSSINQSILVKRTNSYYFCDEEHPREANIDENFEKDFGIYDLPRFLTVLG